MTSQTPRGPNEPPPPPPQPPRHTPDNTEQSMEEPHLQPSKPLQTTMRTTTTTTTTVKTVVMNEAEPITEKELHETHDYYERREVVEEHLPAQFAKPTPLPTHQVFMAKQSFYFFFFSF